MCASTFLCSVLILNKQIHVCMGWDLKMLARLLDPWNKPIICNRPDHHHWQVPYSSRMWTVMNLHCSRSWASLVHYLIFVIHSVHGLPFVTVTSSWLSNISMCMLLVWSCDQSMVFLSLLFGLCKAVRLPFLGFFVCFVFSPGYFHHLPICPHFTWLQCCHISGDYCPRFTPAHAQKQDRPCALLYVQSRRAGSLFNPTHAAWFPSRNNL